MAVANDWSQSMNSVKSWVSLVLTLCAVTIIAAAQDTSLPGSVKNLMLTVITPATDTIWGVEDPQTDEEWQVLIDAATQVIDVSRQIKNGGTGPNDSAWAEDPEWQRFADVLIESGVEIQAAAQARDLDTLMDVSNEKMYPPCEECHLQFNPGVQ
jgi:hypothetical protein